MRSMPAPSSRRIAGTRIAGVLVLATIVGLARADEDPPAGATAQAAASDETDDALPVTAPTLDAPRLPVAPIVAACGHLLEAESRRIALPAGRVELERALQIASLGAELRIDGDWAALDAIGVRASDDLDLPTQAGSIPVVLDQLLGLLSDAWDRTRLEANADGLVITSNDGARRLSGPMLHPIGDLLVDRTLPAAIPTDEGPRTPERFAELVRSMIEPDGWHATGGRLGRIVGTDQGLLVTAPPSVQIKIRRLLDQFRLGRPHDLEASIELVRIDAETARRLEASSGPGSMAAVRAVRRRIDDPPLLEANLVVAVDGDGAETGCTTHDLEAGIELVPVWDADRRRLRCRMTIELEAASLGGRRLLTLDQEIAVPVGGLVVPLPRSEGQPPLAVLMIVRAR